MHANIKQFNNLVAINLFNKFNPIFHISLLIPLVYEADLLYLYKIEIFILKLLCKKYSRFLNF